MSRPSGTYATVSQPIIAGTMFFVGFASAIGGLVFAGIEMFHAAIHSHPPIYMNIGLSVGFILGGLRLIQTGSVKRTMATIGELFASRVPGGNRSTDPSLDEETQ